MKKHKELITLNEYKANGFIEIFSYKNYDDVVVLQYEKFKHSMGFKVCYLYIADLEKYNVTRNENDIHTDSYQFIYTNEVEFRYHFDHYTKNKFEIFTKMESWEQSGLN